VSAGGEGSSAAGERHRDDSRLAAEAEAQDQQRHQRQHGRRHQEQNVRGDDFLDERKLGDYRRQQEPDRAADGETDDQFVERGDEVRPEEWPFGVQRQNDLAGLRHDVLGHVEDAQQNLGAPDDHHGDQHDHGGFQVRARFAQPKRTHPGDARLVRRLFPVEFGDLVSQNLVHADLRSLKVGGKELKRPPVRALMCGRGRFSL